ncbi:protein tyrosine/serine phosphatase [Catenuloplanes nepalensis]|uniref:Protein tyrosine/serine phosphatase n=2 Tax=Catenuloplanes nepalensis TaxID=587533 RepID=A0ABT9N1W0_9ACTN|nr:protein tyrosine/serine phosphatase [Catenuloplanes nepalensis]
MEMTRTFPFSATFNFRDVGGYPGLDGRTVRWRRLFRSDSLHRLDAADEAAFRDLGVKSVIDLRRPHEITRDGRVPEHFGLDYHHIHPEHAEWEDTPFEGSGLTNARWMADRYRDMAETGAAGWAEALTLIAAESTAPVVVHCVAGKDRTGITVALTLGLLGVSDDDIIADYALSTEASDRFSAHVKATWAGTGAYPTPFFGSEPETIATFLTELRAKHGSIEAYALHAGVTPTAIAAMRTHLLTT